MGDVQMLARAVESAVFQCLMNAMNAPSREIYWRNKADVLESKFKTDFGRHYSYFCDGQQAKAAREG